MESQELKELSFSIVFRKNKWQSFQKKIQNTLFWGPFCSNLDKNGFSTKTAHRHFLVSISPLTSCNRSEKTNELIQKKTLERTNTGEIIGPSGKTGRSNKLTACCSKRISESLLHRITNYRAQNVLTTAVQTARLT